MINSLRDGQKVWCIIRNKRNLYVAKYGIIVNLEMYHTDLICVQFSRNLQWLFNPRGTEVFNTRKQAQIVLKKKRKRHLLSLKTQARRLATKYRKAEEFYCNCSIMLYEDV